MSKAAPAAAAAATSAKKQQQIGHRRVSRDGLVTFKRRSTADIMTAIQLGIEHTVSRENQTPLRDLLIRDFHEVASADFPSCGGRDTPAHNLANFAFKCYAPSAFRHFRSRYAIDAAQFLNSICAQNLLELANAGASGSIFYRTADDAFVIKTVQRREAAYLRRLLQQYYITLTQNPATLLPKYYGLYCYSSGSKRIRFVVMNNLLPSRVDLVHKFDLKGSTHKRRASPEERARTSPTLKDLDFREIHPGGLCLDPRDYDRLTEGLARDCLVLRSFSIMDYSLLIGVAAENAVAAAPGGLAGVPARSERGERLVLYLGIIDILQDYRLVKQLEHGLRSIVADGDSVSVAHPDFYSARYLAFMSEFVFKRGPSLALA